MFILTRLFLEFGSAPLFNKRETILMCPFKAALCKDVYPN